MKSQHDNPVRRPRKTRTAMAPKDTRTSTPRKTARALPIALLRAREAVMSNFRPLVAEAGLTVQQWRVLRVLGEDGPLDPTQIAESSCILMPSLSRILRNLEDERFIRRAPHPDDKRRCLISISAKARRRLLKFTPASNAIYDEMQKRYGNKRMRDLLIMLEELAGQTKR